MSSGKKDETGKNPMDMSRRTYKQAVAKQRKIKKLRKMKTKDREGDVVLSDMSDVECKNIVEEKQDDWLNDLLGPSEKKSEESSRGSISSKQSSKQSNSVSKQSSASKQSDATKLVQSPDSSQIKLEQKPRDTQEPSKFSIFSIFSYALNGFCKFSQDNSKLLGVGVTGVIVAFLLKLTFGR